MPEQKEIIDIIKDCQQGKESAYEKLYRGHFGFLYSIALRYAKDGEEAKDLVQQAFMRICKSIDRFDFDGSFKAWAKKILTNEAINYFKRINQSNKSAYFENMVDFEYHEDMQVSEEIVLAKLSYDDLMAMVFELPPAYKTVFTMYVIDGYKHQEISEMLSITVSTSKSNLSRAKGILINKLTKAGIGLKKKLVRYA
ncbi:MAG: RNA polymerase sigma factor [Bacteroidetes bacterium]|nr:RNA polymerase sigma factor [Bacteroidota bacterium]